MKIVNLTTDFKPKIGGIAELAYQICRELAARGHKVDVVTNKMHACPNRHKIDAFSVNRIFQGRPPLSIYSAKGITQVPLWLYKTRKVIGHFLRSSRPDVILCTNPKSMWRPLARAAGCNYILFVHGDDVAANFQKKNPIPALMTRKLIVDASWTFFNSTYSMLAVGSGVGGFKGKVSVVGCGFPVEEIVDQDLRDSARQELGWGNETVLLTVSRTEFRKGIDTTLQCLTQVLQKFPTCRYIIAGQGSALKSLKDMAKNLGLSDKVDFLGHVSEKKKRTLYLASDLFVMPSRPGRHGEVEGFGISFLEANAYGLGVIGSLAGGIPDAIEDGQNGLLVPPDDPEALACAICELLVQPELRRQMALKGQERIRARFNWPRIVDDVEKRLEHAAKHS